MTKLRIAVISDMHVGTSARGLDLCPHDLEPDQKTGRHEDYIGLFEDLARSPAVTSNGKFDMLCITGDISNEGHPDEFTTADLALRKIAASLNIGENSIFFAPGNHDLNWAVMDLKPTAFWSTQRYAPLPQENLSFSRRHADIKHGSLDKEPFYVVWETGDAIIVSINSAAYDKPTAKPHNGIVKQRTVEDLDDHFRNKYSGDTRYRICLLHHHLEQYSEPLPDIADFSTAVNAENLIAALGAHHFDLVLHGHKHHPRLKTYQNDNKHPYISLCAGSFSAILHPLYYENISNLFHIVNIEGRDVATGGIKGRVETWSHSANSWMMTNKVRGLHAIEAFGSNASPIEIEAQILRAAIRNVQTAKFCTWSQMVSNEPGLGHIRTATAFELLKKVCHAQGWDMAGDVNVLERKWIVYDEN